MKLLNTPEHENNFKKFTLSFEVGSEKEAVLLWHVFNRTNLKEVMFKLESEWSYGRNYNQDRCSVNLCDNGGDEIRAFIGSKIKSKI